MQHVHDHGIKVDVLLNLIPILIFRLESSKNRLDSSWFKKTPDFLTHFVISESRLECRLDPSGLKRIDSRRQPYMACWHMGILSFNRAKLLISITKCQAIIKFPPTRSTAFSFVNVWNDLKEIPSSWSGISASLLSERERDRERERENGNNSALRDD